MNPPEWPKGGPIEDPENVVLIRRNRILVKALLDILEMAGKRKSCIRMPNGMMLDSFCRHALNLEKQNP